MPEGHTVRRLADRFESEFTGHRVTVTSPQGRFADGAGQLDGRVLVAAEAAGKQMFLGFEGDRWLRVHLGLYGKWTFGLGLPPEPRGALRVRLATDDVWADLRGPTGCDVVTPDRMDVYLAELGPDPLRRDGRAAEFARRVSRRRTSIAVLLMDQTVIAGVGNVYRAEVLFRAGLSPDLPGRDLDREQVVALWDDLRVLMRDGVVRNAIVTTRPGDRPLGARRGRVTRADAHYVYRRAGLPCRVCATPVATRVLAGRNLFWCPLCQA